MRLASWLTSRLNAPPLPTVGEAYGDAPPNATRVTNAAASHAKGRIVLPGESVVSEPFTVCLLLVLFCRCLRRAGC